MLKQILFLTAMVLGTSSIEYPPGLSPAACPNYPFCSHTPIAADPRSPIIPYTAPGYPANMNPATCPNYPYCQAGFGVPYLLIHHSAPIFPANVDASICPNYPFCSYHSPVPANVDPVKCPNYPFC